MLDIKFVRENPEIVKENIRKKFQDQKLPMVDEVIELDRQNRAAITEASDLRAQRKNQLSKANGPLFGKLKKAAEEEKAAIQAQIDANMAAVKADDERLMELEKLEEEYAQNPPADDEHPQHHRPLRAHRPGRLRERRGRALRRACGARL